MNREYGLQSFYFDQQAAFDQEVKTKRTRSLKLFVTDNDFLLTLGCVSMQIELYCQTPLVNGLQLTGSFIFMHFDCCADQIMS